MVAVFTVYFESPFWVAVLESEDDEGFAVARHVFGAEPSNAELREFLLHRLAELPRNVRPGDEERKGQTRTTNPKRAQRRASRDAAFPPSTKAQAALKLALEARKTERRARSSAERRAEAETRFALRAEKRRQKREGH